MLTAMDSEVKDLRRRCDRLTDECRGTVKKLKTMQKGYVFVYVITRAWLQEWDCCQTVPAPLACDLNTGRYRPENRASQRLLTLG